MASFLRRFVYLVVDGQKPWTLDLHRINMSRFFHPRYLPVEPAAMLDARLPRPTMTFYAPASEQRSGNNNMHFMLIARDKVLATDHTGRASIYDASLRAMRTAPTLSKPKHRPVSVVVGDRLFVIDSIRRGADIGEEEHCFEALAYEHVPNPEGILYDDWRCHSLPTPPYRPAAIRAYAVVGGSELWVSTEEDEGTYSFDTRRGAWAKQGDWTLPFRGLAEYVPEFKLWFAISSKQDGNLFCAFDLAALQHSAPVLLNFWEDLSPPKEWLPLTSSIVHLGSGMFCIIKFFRDTGRDPSKMLAVFTEVEVVPLGKLLKMVKHKSVCYSLGDKILNQWVL